MSNLPAVNSENQSLEALNEQDARLYVEMVRIIERGNVVFYDVGRAYLVIRDSRLYRAEYPSFEAFCQDKLEVSSRRANQLIAGSKIVTELLQLSNSGNNVPINYESSQFPYLPTKEAQTRELGHFDADLRPQIWEEACKLAEPDAPTADQIRIAGGIVEAETDRGDAWEPDSKAHTPAPADPKATTGSKPGKPSRNGDVIPEELRGLFDIYSPELRKARWKSVQDKFPDGATREQVKELLGITETDGDPSAETLDQSVARNASERATEQAKKDALTDDQWLATLPLFPLLSDVPLKTFRGEALAWRKYQKQIAAWKKQVSEIRNSMRRKGSWIWLLTRGATIDPPDEWILCPKREDGGCGGSGQIPLIGQCRKCHGNGYWIN